MDELERLEEEPAADIKKRRQARSNTEQTNRDECAAKKAQIPKLWQQARESLKRQMELLNAKLDDREPNLIWVIDNQPNEATVIRASNGDHVKMTFDPAAFTLTSEWPSSSKTYHAHVLSGGVVSFGDGSMVVPPEQIAKNAFAYLAKRMG